MANRYEAATDDVVKKVEELIDDRFTNLRGTLFEIVMDTKKVKSGGKYQLIKLVKANPTIKHLTTDDEKTEGVDYVMYIDKNVYNELSPTDQNRLIAHALYHTDVDYEKDDPYKVRKPTVQTFYEEIADNTDDPRWAERLDLIADQYYERQSEIEESPDTEE